MRRKSSEAPPPAAVAAAAAVTAGGVTAVLLRLGRRRRNGDHDGDAPEPGRTAAGEQEWRCGCGQEYRVHGEGRHRVYWRSDADPGDPVLGASCPECGRPLPGREVGAAA